jgi:hypothetical protein
LPDPKLAPILARTVIGCVGLRPMSRPTLETLNLIRSERFLEQIVLKCNQPCSVISSIVKLGRSFWRGNFYVVPARSNPIGARRRRRVMRGESEPRRIVTRLSKYLARVFELSNFDIHLRPPLP